LEAIRDYIAQDNPQAAKHVIERIEHSTARLATLPFSARPGLRGTRLLSVPRLPYVVIYWVRGEVVSVLSIFHTARNLRI
jgi:toxin ParE1/3/4